MLLYNTMLLTNASGARMNLTKPAAVLFLLAFALTLSGPVLGNPTNIASGVALSRADKCAICEATVHELIDDLIDSKNQPQLDLDLRGRLDPSGKRKGKVLPYHGSDLHMLELLEKVCDRMSDYSRSVTDDVVSLQRHNPRDSGGSVTLSNVEVDSKVSEKFKQYCSELVGGNEDDITNLVRKAKFEPKRILKHLCHQANNLCSGIKRPEMPWAEAKVEL